MYSFFTNMKEEECSSDSDEYQDEEEEGRLRVCCVCVVPGVGPGDDYFS
jgi:hypothetical protein